MTAEEHLKVIVGDMHAHLVVQLAQAFAERDAAAAECVRLRQELAAALTARSSGG